MRGKHHHGQQHIHQSGITPAGAGKTVLVKIHHLDILDHPRRCGENLGAAEISVQTEWITPAGAGKTPCSTARFISSTGSPPQVRGKQNRGGKLYASNGITPAGAGKTPCGLDRTNIAQDHPRRCGENSSSKPDCRSRAGSPPQVRGKLFMFSPCFPNKRITPAGAGKTITLATLRALLQDHPRRCGENFMAWGSGKRNAGSPPQVRGKQGKCCGCTGPARITPAGAGKTPSLHVYAHGF